MTDKPATTLYTALLKAQQAMGPLTKNAQNPHLKNKYADLSAVLTTIEQPLWDHGLVVVQRFVQDGDQGPILATDLIHVESGERMTSAVRVACKDPSDPQKIGAAITYYRRYSLMTLLGLSAEDDDGNAAAQPKPAPRPQQQPDPLATFDPRRPQDRKPAPLPAREVLDRPNGSTPSVGVDDHNPHPPGSAEHVLFEAERLATAGYTVPDVYKFLTSRQQDLGDDWTTVLKEWRTNIKPMIERGKQPASHAG